MIKKIPGTKDILPEESSLWQEMEKKSRETFSLYNYREIRTPLIEETALFNRTLGESAEIVQKQMFLIKKEENDYCLRPEATASIARAYIENNLDKSGSFAKFYYIGPMFRMERPQKGRLRQFHHIGAEAIGSKNPCLDIEIISLAVSLLKAFKISGYQIRLNSLGCPEDKKKLTSHLRRELKNKASRLCPDCQRRAETNVLRVLDCKNEGCIKISRSLQYDSFFCRGCESHFQKTKEGLDSLKIEYKPDPYLVRGLDYYTGTVFEITHPDLGAQDAIGAGGRYDNLIAELGGTDSAAIGFAFGAERMLLALNTQYLTPNTQLIYLITLGEGAKIKGINILDDLRKAGVACDTDYESKSLKSSLRKANDLSAKCVVIIGENEIKKGTLTLKDMESGEQKEVEQEKLIDEIRLC